MSFIKSKQVNPQAAVIIWNYKERITADPTGDPHAIEEVILSTKDIISISTSKAKKAPAGSFEITMAPTHNWIAKITPGSWCTLLMSRSVFPRFETTFGTPGSSLPGLRKNAGKADKRLVKMLGRINDVRVAVNVDSDTGTRTTAYIITGEDWGGVFNANMYIDPVARDITGTPESLSYIGQAQRIAYNNFVLDLVEDPTGLPTAAQNVRHLVKMWGSPLQALIPSIDLTTKNLPTPQLSSKSQYKLPVPVAQYFGFGGTASKILGGLVGGINTVDFGELVTTYHGPLNGYDTYADNHTDSYGMISPDSVFGIHSVWQLLIDNSNPTLNELIADMRWEDDTPVLALYHRIRPFLVRNNFDGANDKHASKNMSMYSNVRRIKIDKEDVISINAGTNLTEKINFIEIKPYNAFLQENHEYMVKLISQEYDHKAYERDGFRPLIEKPHYLPFDAGEQASLKATEWTSLLREWHFPKDTMLSGAVTFVGLNEYIQVGDNIMIDAGVLGTPFNKEQADKKPAFLLAHVESISHNFTVNQMTGARTFQTTIRFVRGIISDENGKLIGSDKGFSFLPSAFTSNFGDSSDKQSSALDKDAGRLAVEDEVPSNVVSRSTSGDPLTNKLKPNDEE